MTGAQPPGAPGRGAGADDLAAVLAVNQGFYEAFESADLDAMSVIWEHSDRVVCTHPGWATLRGWSRVVSSWYALFAGPQRLQFILTDPVVELVGDLALVSLEENLLDGARGSTVAALNVFARTPVGWKLIVHHGSPVVSR